MNGIANTEAQIAKEEAQIAQLNGQIRRYTNVPQNPVKQENKKSEKQVRPSIIRSSSIFSHHLNVSKRSVSFHVFEIECDQHQLVFYIIILLLRTALSQNKPKVS